MLLSTIDTVGAEYPSAKGGENHFVSFLEDMGQPPPLLTLDRIDNDKGYSKDNCRWADRKTQRRNSSENIIVEVGGRTMCLADAADILGIKRNTLYGRYRRHGDIHRA